MNRPCLDCGALHQNPTRCTPCHQAHQRIRERSRPKRDRTKYQGDYQTRAKLVRATATSCWVCGLPAKPNDPFQADHLDPSDPASPLLAAHRSCNIRRAHQMKKDANNQQPRR